MRATVATLSLALFAGLVGYAPTADAKETFSLRNTSNKEISTDDYAGKVVLVNFWATWCAPCQVEMPHIQKLYTDLNEQGFEVLSISVDDSRSASRVKPLIKSKGYTFEVLLDKETEVVSRYNPQKVLPYTFILDGNGEIVYRHTGYNPGDEDHLREEVLKALAANGAAPDSTPETVPDPNGEQ